MEIRISVVIPTYKRPQLLTKCLQALTRQTLPRNAFEIIVVSDGPDPEAEDRLQAWCQTLPGLALRWHALAEKKGPAAARNLGWRTANAALVAFTDDDCEPAPNWLEALCKAYNGHTEMVMTGRVEVPLPAAPTDYEWNTAHLQTAEFVTANCCCTVAALRATGGFDERFSMAWREDSDLHFKLITRGIPILRVPDAVVRHPVRPAPWGISLYEQKKSQYNALLYKKYPGLFRERIRSGPNWHYHITVLLFLGLLIAALFESRAGVLLSLSGWSLSVGLFAWKRLRPTRKTVEHVAEMIVTSALIPFVSIYWHYYGAIKHKVLLF
jgi:Predicted glycosyltransferases